MTNLQQTNEYLKVPFHYPNVFQLRKKVSSANYMKILQSYSGHALTDLNSAQLMDRVDTKFLLPIRLLPTLLEELVSDYTVLEIEGERLFTYHNTYFDTPNHDFYRMHHQGKLNRYKVRHRYYVNTRTGYLEVKFKNNKGRTIKSRIKSIAPNLNQSEASKFLASKLMNSAHSDEFNHALTQLQSTQFGSYQRIALANEASSERVTLDLNLDFEPRGNQPGSRVGLPDMFIAELKQARHNIHAPFSRLMTKLGIRASKFSKYCIGCSLVTPTLKANRFKPQLLALQKFH